MWLAAQSGRTQIVRKLLEVRTDPDYGEKKLGRTPLWEASWSNHTEMMRGLLEARAKIDVATTSGPAPGRNALMVGAQRGHPDAVQLLIQAGASKELKDRDGRDARDCAREGLARRPQAQRDYADILRLLE